jgi:hypothetical protein
MKEPQEKGVAHHLHLESCAGRRETAGEALTEAHLGRVLSSEIIIRACRSCPVREKAT